MSLSTSRPFVACTISCFDRNKPSPFPVYNKWYWFDWTVVSESDADEILRIVDHRAEPRHLEPNNLNDSVITTSYTSKSPEVSLLKFRRYLREVPNNDLPSHMASIGADWTNARYTSVPGDHVEDETGARITSSEMIAYVTGEEFPIIRGNAESITRIGPAAPVDAPQWNEEKARNIAHFLEVVELLHASEWNRSRPSTTSIASPNRPTELLESRFADDEKTMAVLPYFRQLHGGDRLLEMAVETYTEHCGDIRKQWWVTDQKNEFESVVDTAPCILTAKGVFTPVGITRRRILQMFMYGQGMLHSESNDGADVELEQLIHDVGRLQAVSLLNASLLDFLRITTGIYHVIGQDFKSWTADHGLVPSSRVPIKAMFASYKKSADS